MTYWRYLSSPFNELVRTLGKHRVAARVRARGQEASDWELGVIMGEIRSVTLWAALHGSPAGGGEDLDPTCHVRCLGSSRRRDSEADPDP